MVYVMNGGQISAPNFYYYDIILQGYRENHLNQNFLDKAVRNAEMKENEETPENVNEIIIG